MSQPSIAQTIAVIGGTGKEGNGLAFRWAKAGRPVIIGSRDAARAASAAQEIRHRLGGAATIDGRTNLEAAGGAGIVTLTVPYAAHRDTLESIKAAMEGKLLIDATVPLVRGKVAQAHMPAAGSAAQEAREVLGEEAEVAAAFHSISHELLLGDLPVDCDVLVTGTSRQARETALSLVVAAGLRGWDAGALANSAVTEGLASVLIHVNKTYGSKHAGIRITGI
jgi:NADPH-dependent F420 reductase